MRHFTRRQLLASTAAATASALAAPMIRASGKAARGPIILGEGEHAYEVQHDWGRLPSKIAYGNTHGVCEDAAGNIYIKHTVHASSQSGDAIVVFAPDGNFVRSWGAEYRGGAHGLHYSREAGGEYLYLCDCARGVVDKTTLSGEKVWSKACPTESGLYNNQNEYKPTNVAIVPMEVGPAWKPRAGELFIADGYGKSWIHRYSPTGDYLGSFGGPGKERGQVSCPHGLMVDARDPQEPVLVVADRSNNRLQIFDLDGRHLRFVTDEMRQPCHLHTRGRDMVIPDLLARVTLVDADNKLICHLGDDSDFRLRGEARDRFIPGRFIAPHSAIFDHAGNIFVVEWVEVGRVTKLKRVS